MSALVEISYDCFEGLPVEVPCDSTAVIRTIPELVEKISKVFLYFPCPSQWPKRKECIECLLKNFQMSPEDIKRYGHCNANFPYTRNLICSDGQHFSLLLLCWNPGMESKVHNHPCDGCFVKSIAGQVKETKYSCVTNNCKSMELLSEVVLDQGLVTYMDDFVGYHKVGNSGDDIAVTLHLYTPPYASCKVWGSPHDVTNFFEGTVTYFSEYGHVLNDTKVCCLQSGGAGKSDQNGSSSPRSVQSAWDWYI